MSSALSSMPVTGSDSANIFPQDCRAMYICFTRFICDPGAARTTTGTAFTSLPLLSITKSARLCGTISKLKFWRIIPLSILRNCCQRCAAYVFRKLVYSDSLSIDLTENLAFTNIYQLEKEDNGSFFSRWCPTKSTGN
ncbi:MAG: hypothetical protein R3C26_00520 [Calditrichia bacterium]